MAKRAAQPSLLGDLSPSELWDRDIAQRALDELIHFAQQYNSSSAYLHLLRFVGRFRTYSPFNSLLVHIQLPGATYVAPAHRWADDYGRRIKVGARPLVILQPMGPVMFVFDVSDTGPMEGAPPLPPEVEHPFEVRRGRIGKELLLTVENAKRDGIRITAIEAGSNSAGSIEPATPGQSLEVLVKTKSKKETTHVPLRYELALNSDHSPETKYATAVHELAHLYCGHLGTPNPKWWSDRRGLSQVIREFEAESVCYLICRRLGIDNPSDEYLAGYLRRNKAIPPISLDCVLTAAGQIEQMGQGRLKPRKPDHR